MVNQFVDKSWKFMNQFNLAEEQQGPPNVKALWRWLRKIVHDLYDVGLRDKFIIKPDAEHVSPNFPLQINVIFNIIILLNISLLEHSRLNLLREI